MLPIALNTLFMPVARAPIPAVVAKATRAKIIRYSTKPWPVSSVYRPAREFRTKVIIAVGLLEFLAIQLPRLRGVLGHAMPRPTPQVDDQSTRRRQIRDLLLECVEQSD